MTNATMPHVVKLANMASAPCSLPIPGCSRGLNVAGGAVTSGSVAREQGIAFTHQTLRWRP
jgi:hypothetical protein